MLAKRFFHTVLTVATLSAPLALLPATQSYAAVFVSVNIAPPTLPVYTQPICPGEGYLWTPGYWAYADAGYYWVPGVWVQPPSVGVLWTPPYWGWEGGAYLFHAGYWGPHVGFYGGINYGFGYGGSGFFGGEWRSGGFFYNRAVSNVNVTNVTNVYNRTVIVNNHTTIAYNGGPNGVGARPTPEQISYGRESHLAPTANQLSHQNFAAQDRSQFASINHGRPGIPAAASVSSFRQNPQNATFAARPTLDQREANQDQRVANGLRNGQMTAGEAARISANQQQIDQQVHSDRSVNGGRLTQQQRQQIYGEQNAASRQIYQDNHNGNSVAPNAVNAREANQQQRVANDLRSGQMTSGEAARANGRQAGVDAQVHSERLANGGKLTGTERQDIHRQQNDATHQVTRENHNNHERH